MKAENVAFIKYAVAYFVAAVSYTRKMFIKLAPDQLLLILKVCLLFFTQSSYLN